MPDVPNYRIEAPPGELSPPLVSEDAAHDWAAVNRRGEAYLLILARDGHEIARRQFEPRPS